MEFCVYLLLAQDRIGVLRDERRELDEYTESERARIAGLRALVLEAAEAANTDGDDSMSGRAVKRVRSAGEQAIASTLDELESKLASDRADIARRDREERDGCLDAFGKWIALHAAHEGTWKLSIQLKDNNRYDGETTGTAPYGAQWKCALDLESGHPMVNGIRVGDLVTQIELALPEPGGFLKKGKLRPQRIDPYSIDAFATDGTESTFTLRATPRGPAGLDVVIREDKVKVTLAGAKDATNVDVSEDDRQRLLTLRDRILDALTTHEAVRRRVVSATLDDQPLADGDDLAEVADRIIGAAAPIVQQIRIHSQSPNELVIRRLLGNDRREEIFVSTSSLLDKLGRLPRARRRMFAPLGLEWQRATTPPPFAAVVVPEEVVHSRIEEPPPAAESPAPAADGPADQLGNIVIDPEMLAAEEPPKRPTPPPTPKRAPTAPTITIEATPPEPEDTPPERSSKPELTVEAHTKDALTQTVKRIVGFAREGRTTEVYQAYATLFSDSGFAQQRPQDQRQVLKLMVQAKTIPQPSQQVREAYKNALSRLEALHAESKDPVDQELISACDRFLGTV